MITCRECNLEKEDTEFALRSMKTGKRHYRCKSCQSSYCKAHYTHNKTKHNSRRYKTKKTKRKAFREFLDEIKSSSPCKDCGVQYIPFVMQFDHVIGVKKFNISEWSQVDVNKEDLLNEIRKCDLVCSNCHAIRTWNRLKEQFGITRY